MSLLALQHGFRDWLTREADHVASRCVRHGGAGLAVYLNNYRAQLMACLTESYGGVRAWLGDAAFDAAAATHIDRVPPSSWTLDDYMLDFPDTLADLYPHDPEVSELARLELALASLFTVPDHRPVDPAGLAAIDWDRATLRFVPGLQLRPVATNAGAIWSAIMRGETPPPAQRLAAGAAILVWREGFTPTFRTVVPAEAKALDLLQRGGSFGTLCAWLVAEHGEAEGPGLAGSYLAQWLNDEIISAVSS
jgi:hypothetical protein